MLPGADGATHTVQPGAGTLQAAVDSASWYDTLELQDGTNTKGSYDRVLTLTTPITIRAVNSGSAILDGASSTNGMIDITTSSSSVHVTLEGLHITNGATWYCGGGLKITMTNTQSVLNLRHCSIYGHHVGAWYYGGGACIYAGQVNFDHCQIFDNSADAGAGVALFPKTGPILQWTPMVTFRNSELYSNEAPNMYGAAIDARHQSSDKTKAVLHIINTTIHSNRAGMHGAGINMYYATIHMENSLVHSNVAELDGGGLHGEAGTLFVRGDSMFFNNSAGRRGQDLHIPGTELTVLFPLTPGHWLPNGECRVYREPCALNDAPCLAAFEACSLVPDVISLSNGGNTLSTTVPSGCQPRIFVQPCNWMDDNSLLQSPTPLEIYSPPLGVPIDVTFPYTCSPGILGSSDSGGQTSALCAGVCPGGYYCPTAATTQALDCPPAHCERRAPLERAASVHSHAPTSTALAPSNRALDRLPRRQLDSAAVRARHVLEHPQPSERPQLHSGRPGPLCAGRQHRPDGVRQGHVHRGGEGGQG